MPRRDRAAQIASMLEQSILSGKMATGDRLPPERELSVRLGVSRSVVREALGQLVAQGLVRSIQGSGTRVEMPDGRTVSNGLRHLLRRDDFRIEDVSAVRMPLETTIAALAAAHRQDEHLKWMKETQKVLANPRRSLKSYIQADLDFHAALADASGNPIFNIILAPIQELLVESRRRTISLRGTQVVHEDHARILDAVEAGDAREASRAMKLHIENNMRHLAEFRGSGDEGTHRRPRMKAPNAG